MLSLRARSVSKERNASRERKTSQQIEHRPHAPHPIPAGLEGKVCPITGLTADGNTSKEEATTAATALAELEADPDIAEERSIFLQRKHLSAKQVQRQMSVDHSSGPHQFVRLNVVDRKFKANSQTRDLVRVAGGLPALRAFTKIFYEKCFADPHIDQFIRRHSDPHGERFALWIVEKFGDGTPWTDSRRSRPVDVMELGNQVVEVAFDRSSAHFAAWHSPKREAHKWGKHFQLDDARVWMRLHFWAAREAGFFEPECAAFMDYYIRFIGHFISIYSSKSPPFTRESARWSADPRNIHQYIASGNMMMDVIDQPLEQALAQLPAHERKYTGSQHVNPAWPYGGPYQSTV